MLFVIFFGVFAVFLELVRVFEFDYGVCKALLVPRGATDSAVRLFYYAFRLPRGGSQNGHATRHIRL